VCFSSIHILLFAEYHKGLLMYTYHFSIDWNSSVISASRRDRKKLYKKKEKERGFL